MSIEQNKATVRRFHEFFDQGDISGCRSLLAHNCTAYRAGMPPLNLEAFMQLGTMFVTAFGDGHTLLEDIVAEGNVVYARGTWNATHRGDFNGIPATGKHITITFIVLHRFENGKIVENREEADILGLLQQLGAVPTPQMGD